MAAKTISSLDAAGSVTGDELFEVSQLSTTVTITGTTLSAQASDNSFNDSATGFLTAGFTVGDRVKVVGFTGNVANNIVVGSITALTSGKMTIGGTDGDVIVDDAAGESVTIAKWTSKRMTSQAFADYAASLGAYSEVATVSSGTANLLAAQAGMYVRYTSVSAKTLTVQEDATEALPANGEWHIRNVGLADLTFVEDGVVVINPPGGGTLVVPQGGTVTLKRVGTDVFDLLGQTVAA